MAFVTDMRGEWSAGVTPHTVWYPTIPDKPNTVSMEVNSAFGETIPRPTILPTPKKKCNLRA